MKRFKKIMLGALSILTLGLFVVTGTKVSAKTNSFYFASNDTNQSYASGDYIETDSMLKMQTYAATSTVSTSYLNGTYTSSLHYDANTNSTKGFRFENQSEKDLTITISMAAYDSGTSLKSHPIWFSTDGTYSNQIGTSSTSGLVTVNATLPASTATTTSYGILCCCNSGGGNARRLVVYEVKYSYIADDDKTISFYDGTTKLDEIGYASGETINFSPSNAPVNYYFDGWYEDSLLTTPLASTTVSSSTPTTLYAKWSMYSTFIDSTNLDVTGTITENYYNNSIFNLSNIKVESNSGKQMPNTGANCSYRINTNGTATATNKVITFVAPYSCEMVIYTVGNSDKILYVCEDSFNTATAKLTHNFTDTNMNVVTVEVIEGKTYYIGTASSSTYIYGIYLGQDKAIGGSISCQYDTADSTQATALRLVGTIKGLSVASDYSKLTDATFSFKFDGTPKSKSCSRIYKSVSAYNFAAGTYNLYVVLTVSNVNSNIGKNITDLKLTLTFNDGTTKEITHDSFTLGYTTLVEA